MIKVKISYPSWWDEDWGGAMYLKETSKNEGIWDDVMYYINQVIEECDYWFVYDDIDQYLTERTKCPPQNVFLITGEVVPEWQYPEWFVKQFSGVLTARKDIYHPLIHSIQHICVWHVKKNYDELIRYQPVKTKDSISAIISGASTKPGHKNRLIYMRQIAGELNEELEWFGKGIRPIDDKWKGLEPYKYSIAIENSTYHNYFTEKIIDCFLAYTIPIYYGCPNITDIFPKESMIRIDIKNPKESVKIIKEAIRTDYYTQHYDALVEARNIALHHSGFFPYLTSWIKANQNHSKQKKEKIMVKGRRFNNLRTTKQKLYSKSEILKMKLKGYHSANSFK